MLADFEPGIFFLLLWGLLSWFISNKKKNRTDSGEVVTKPKPKEDLFSRIQKLQEHLSKEVEIFPSAPPPDEIEEEYFAGDDEYGLDKMEISAVEPEDMHEDEGCVFEADFIVPTKEHKNWLKQNLSCKTELRKLMVFKEVLGEPRSLKPYTGDYFQS